MHIALIQIILLLFWITGTSPNKSHNVHQTPADLLWEIKSKVKLTCKHSVDSYDTVLWYQRSGGDSTLKLVAYTSYTRVQEVEKDFQGSFNVSGDGEREAFLHLLKLRHPEDSGHYFCAAYSCTTIEKPQIPQQKPSSTPAANHMNRHTEESAARWAELER